MATFSLKFKSRFTVASPDAQVRLIALETDEPAVQTAAALVSLQSITQSLASLERAFTLQIDELSDRVSEIAVSVAAAVLQDEELVEQRTKQFVVATLNEFRPAVPDTVFVHPDCVDTIKNWMEESGNQTIKVEGDASVTPGDCRVEADGVGAAATLEAFLTAVTAQFAGNTHQLAAA